LILIAGAVGALMAINEWNSLPFFIDSMPTSAPYMQSLLYGLLLGLGSGAGVFFYVILAAAPGEPLYRASQPEKLSLLKLPTLGAIRTREFFRATVAGYGFAAVHLAFVVAFYLVGRRFGVWSPQDVNYSDFLSTGLPWIYPLTISLMAATSEEFWFRLLAIPLLKRYLRSTWLAVLIPAFLWGFLHSNYPQQPGYIRGVEVGIIGVAAGFLMLRFGILATLIWHYTVDAVMIGMFLFHGGSWYFQLSGCLVAGAVLFPLAVSLVFYWRHGGFLVDPSLLNSGQEIAAESAPALVEAAPAVEPRRPRWKVKWLYYAAGAAAVAGLALPSATEYGGFIRVRQSRAQAETIAARELGSRVPGLNAWRRVTSFQANLETGEFEYLRRVVGSQAANEAVREHTETGLWMVRYFQPLRVEEWRVYVSQQGTVAKVNHILEDKASGARLSLDEARRLAERYLANDQSGRSGDWRLLDSASESKDRRTDHSFVWENNTFRLGGAKARLSLDVQGDEVSGVRRYLKLPEEWVREFHRPRLAGILMPGAAGAVGFLLLILFIRRLSGAGDAAATRFHWRAYAALGVSGAGLAALAALNRWPLALAAYDTAKPIESFQSEFVIGGILAMALAAFGLFVAALAADVFLQWAAAGSAPRRPSLARAAAVFGLLWGVARMQAYVTEWLPGPRLSLPLWDLPGAETYWPAVTLLASAFITAGGALCAATVGVCTATRLCGPRGRYALIVAPALLLAVGRAQTVPQLIAHWGLGLLAGDVLVLLVRTCAADLLTFGVALFWLAAAQPATVLVQQPETVLRWNGIACLAVAFAAGAVVLQRFARVRSCPSGAG
jgi:membrane protease YdiL (CAAX protease family)